MTKHNLQLTLQKISLLFFYSSLRLQSFVGLCISEYIPLELLLAEEDFCFLILDFPLFLVSLLLHQSEFIFSDLIYNTFHASLIALILIGHERFRFLPDRSGNDTDLRSILFRKGDWNQFFSFLRICLLRFRKDGWQYPTSFIQLFSIIILLLDKRVGPNYLLLLSLKLVSRIGNGAMDF